MRGESKPAWSLAEYASVDLSYSFDAGYNIRSASIVGYVGAGGVGVLLHVYQEYYQWDRFATVLLFILALVTLLDVAGEWVRRQVAPRIPGTPIGG